MICIQMTQDPILRLRKEIHSYCKFYKMFIEKQDRTIRTLYNQRGWCGLFFLLVKIKLSEAMVTRASSFTVSLTAEVDSDIT